MTTALLRLLLTQLLLARDHYNSQLAIIANIIGSVGLNEPRPRLHIFGRDTDLDVNFVKARPPLTSRLTIPRPDGRGVR